MSTKPPFMMVMLPTQFTTKDSKMKVANLNVPCTGRFDVCVWEDGFWEVVLHAIDGDTYYRTRGTMLPNNGFYSFTANTTCEIEEWMWEAIYDKINELKMQFEHGALETLNVKGHC